MIYLLTLTYHFFLDLKEGKQKQLQIFVLKQQIYISHGLPAFLREVLSGLARLTGLYLLKGV